MVTIYRAHGLRIVIFTDDHEPAHVHVFGDGEAKINLIGAGGDPESSDADGFGAQRGIPRAVESDPWLN